MYVPYHLPIRLFFVRHGQSHANVVISRSARGDHRGFTKRFRQETDRRHRLTARGKREARAAGRWLRRNVGVEFDDYVASEFFRTTTTGARFELPDARWRLEPLLSEQDWGDLNGLTSIEQQTQFARSLAMQRRDLYYWKPPNGDSMLDVGVRAMLAINKLRRRVPSQRVVVVTHERVLWSIRVELEHLTVQRMMKRIRSKDPVHHIHNCQIIEYSREHPTKKGELTDDYSWYRSICPWDESLSDPRWKRIVERRFTNEQILRFAEGLQLVKRFNVLLQHAGDK